MASPSLSLPSLSSLSFRTLAPALFAALAASLSGFIVLSSYTKLSSKFSSSFFGNFRYSKSHDRNSSGSRERKRACREFLESEDGSNKTGREKVVVEGLLGCIGNTKLVRIESLSKATGCNILGKAEFLNPGGSMKDRVAKQIILEALESGQLKKGGLITEGSAGSTGVSLALVANAVGCKCYVALPDDVAQEKSQILEALGAEVKKVRPVSITHRDHFVNVARRRAEEEDAKRKEWEELQGRRRRVDSESTLLSSQGSEVEGESANGGRREKGGNGNGKVKGRERVDVPELEKNGTKQDVFTNLNRNVGQEEEVEDGEVEDEKSNGMRETESPKGGFFADQFENLGNFRAHYGGTAVEIWDQTGGEIHGFVASAGTGGGIAGISRYLKEKNPQIKCFLIDPPGSSLYNRVTRGVLFTREEREGKRLRNPFDTITEGIGINRLTKNFELAKLDGAFRGTDREAVEMARYLLQNDGLFVGSSSAMNCVGAVRLARFLETGSTIVTILCDGGHRHLSRFHNPAYLASLGLTPKASGLEFLNL